MKSSTGRTGPGPNYFSSSTNNAWVDAQGLHLKITRVKGRWYCAEVILQRSLGFGTYRFVLSSPVDTLDPNVVLGLFTWSDDPAYAHREIDVEFARWGSTTERTNAQYVVQPYDAAGHLIRFTQPPGASPSTHSFTWTSGRVAFQSYRGTPATPGAQIASWTYPGADVPLPGDENPRINLWLNKGLAPANRSEVEVVVQQFSFSPA